MRLLYITCMLLLGTILQSGNLCAATPEDTSGFILELDISADSAEFESSHSDSLRPDIDSVISEPLDKDPVLLKFVEAAYPGELAKQGIAGTVVLSLLINGQGTVDSIAVIKGLHRDIDSAVAIAVRQFIFSPAIADSLAVAVLLTYEYHITLDKIVSTIEEYVNFSGRVVERGTRTPVPDATVAISFGDSAFDTALGIPFGVYLNKIGSFDGQHLESGKIITHTDSLGQFAFKSLPSGPIKIIIPVPGYEKFEELERISREELTEVVFRIDRVSYADYEIVVYGKSERKEVSRRTLTLSEVRKIPGFGGDAVKVVQALPGVARSSFGSGAIYVRGSPTWDSKFYLDGVNLPQLYHFGGIKSTYNSEALSSVSLYPGGFGSRYGGAIAGVIEIEGREAQRDRAHGFGDANLIDASVMVEGPLGENGGILVSARRSYVGDLLNFALKQFDWINLPVTVAPYYYDYTVRTDYDLTKGNHLFLTLFGSTDKLELVVPFIRGGSREVDELTDRVKQQNGFHMGIFGWNIDIGSKMKNELRASATRGDGSTSIFGLAKWEFTYWEFCLRNQLSYSLFQNVTANIGLDLDQLLYTQRSVFPLSDNLFWRDTIDMPFGITGAYANLEWRLWDKLLLTPSLRYDYFSELTYDGSIFPEFWDYHIENESSISGEPALRLTARYEYMQDHTIKAAVGSYSQTPQPVGLATHEKFGNPGLGATKARHLVAGYEWQATDLATADLQLYHNYQWEIPRFATSADIAADPENAPRLLPDGEGRMYGLELLLRHDQGKHFFGWLAYTLSRTERFSPVKGAYTLYDRDQTHNLQLIASSRLPREWQLGVRTRFVSGNPYTPVIGRVYNITGRSYRPISGEENSARNDPFFQLDLRIDKKIIFSTWILSFYLDVQNVLSFVYASPEFTIYNYDYTERGIISSPLIPSLGLRVEF